MGVLSGSPPALKVGNRRPAFANTSSSAVRGHVLRIRGYPRYERVARRLRDEGSIGRRLSWIVVEDPVNIGVYVLVVEDVEAPIVSSACYQINADLVPQHCDVLVISALG